MVKDLLEKRENKTPEKISKTLIFPKDNNNSNEIKKYAYLYLNTKKNTKENSNPNIINN